MDFYQQYDFSYIISLYHSEKLLFTEGNLEYLNAYNAHIPEFEYSQSFQFNEKTGELNVGPTDTVEDGNIYISNITRALYKLYKSIVRKETDLENNKEFNAIVKFFQSCLGDVSKKRNLEKLYFVIIMPDEWAMEPDIIDLVLSPLLVEIGVKLPTDSQERAIFITRLKARLAYFQLISKKRIPPFVFNESRCIMHQICEIDKEITIKSIYFQMKEDYDLRTMQDRFYIPKILSINQRLVIESSEFDHIKDMLKQTIFKKILNQARLIKRRIDKTTSVADYILDMIIHSVMNHIAGRDASIDGSDEILCKYMNSPQIAFLRSTAFLELTLGEIQRILPELLKGTLHAIKLETDKIPFIRKSVIFAGQYSDEMTLILLQFLKEESGKSHNGMYKSNWYDFTNDFFDSFEEHGAALMAARIALASNNNLPPVLVVKDSVLTKIGLPSYSPVLAQPAKCNIPPEIIVYIDISVNSTLVVCEALDNDGFIIQEFNIDTRKLNAMLTSKGFDFPFFFKILGSRKLNVDLCKTDRLNTILHATKSKVSSRAKRVSNKIKTILDLPLHKKSRLLDTSSNIVYLKSLFSEYLKQVVSYINKELNIKGTDVRKAGYALSIEKSLLDGLCIEDKQEFFKESIGNCILIDQAEKVVWDTYQNDLLENPCYYVHVHISNDCLYLKLNQVVDINESSSTVFIMDKFIRIENTYQQVGQLLWNYMQARTIKEDSNCLNNFQRFIEKLLQFMEKQSESTHQFKTKHDLQISDSCSINFTTQELVDKAINPTVKQLCSLIVACLTNAEIFGFYDVSKLYITGTLLSSYDKVITTEMNKELKWQLREKACRTKFNININAQLQENLNVKKKSFCYDIFLNGHLSIVASSTYFVDNANKDDATFICKDLDKYENLFYLISQGTKLSEKRIQVELCPSSTCAENVYWPGVYRFSEKTHDSPHSPDRYGTCGFVPNSFNIIHVRVLHHLSCIKITLESYGKTTCLHKTDEGCNEMSLVFGERQTLKYF